MYNGLISLRNRTQESWRQIDVELKRRHDLIPNLVETVKGYATHERGTLESVMNARAQAVNAQGTPAATAAAEGQLTQALGRLMAVAEAYPQLQANQNFLALQQELSSTEDRIASARRYYNATVKELNTKVESFPTNQIAERFSIHREEYFEVEDTARSTPQVNFDTGSPRTYTAEDEPAQDGPFRTAPAPAAPALPQDRAPQSGDLPQGQSAQGQSVQGQSASQPAAPQQQPIQGDPLDLSNDQQQRPS
nr:LemA family protein [Arsenicicoccus piscis]